MSCDIDRESETYITKDVRREIKYRMKKKGTKPISLWQLFPLQVSRLFA